jgi:hypothetical protein
MRKLGNAVFIGKPQKGELFRDLGIYGMIILKKPQRNMTGGRNLDSTGTGYEPVSGCYECKAVIIFLRRILSHEVN